METVNWTSSKTYEATDFIVIPFDELERDYGWNRTLVIYTWGEKDGILRNQYTSLGIGMRDERKGIRYDIPAEGMMSGDLFYMNICIGNLKFESSIEGNGENEKVKGSVRIRSDGLAISEGMRIYYFD